MSQGNCIGAQSWRAHMTETNRSGWGHRWAYVLGGAWISVWLPKCRGSWKQDRSRSCSRMVDHFTNRKQVPGNWGKMYLFEAFYSKTWPTDECETIVSALFARGIWCWFSCLSLRVAVAGLEILCIKRSSCVAWYPCASLIGRGRFYYFKM